MSETVAPTEVEVYQLHRGDHREDARAMAAEHLRFQMRSEDGIDVDAREFERFWSHAGTDSLDRYRPEAVLSAVWHRWNYSSGRESKAFIDAETRSLEVGDVVAFDGSHYLCLPIGWEEIEISEADP